MDQSKDLLESLFSLLMSGSLKSVAGMRYLPFSSVFLFPFSFFSVSFPKRNGETPFAVRETPFVKPRHLIPRNAMDTVELSPMHADDQRWGHLKARPMQEFHGSARSQRAVTTGFCTFIEV